MDIQQNMQRFEAAMREAFDYTPERNPFTEVVPHAEEAYQFGRDCDRFMGWCLAMQLSADSFQSRVRPWMLACFGAEISADAVERNHRFFEEASELVQSCGMTASEARQLVDYTWSRPVGEKNQEAGGVMVTLAALCLAQDLDMHAAGETELERISAPAMMAKIRAKQAAKPKHSPLPEAPSQDVKTIFGDAQHASLRAISGEIPGRSKSEMLNEPPRIPIHRGDCAIKGKRMCDCCQKVAVRKVDIQVDWFRGNDEVMQLCELHYVFIGKEAWRELFDAAAEEKDRRRKHNELARERAAQRKAARGQTQ